jgi:hypothetical protein
MSHLYCPECGAIVTGAEVPISSADGGPVKLHPPVLRPCGHRGNPRQLTVDTSVEGLTGAMAVIRRPLLSGTQTGQNVIVDRAAARAVVAFAQDALDVLENDGDEVVIKEALEAMRESYGGEGVDLGQFSDEAIE